ncbi:MAG: HlyD family efflux transporter periplasmic adaptor subunit [Oligoflexales bacterium]
MEQQEHLRRTQIGESELFEERGYLTLHRLTIIFALVSFLGFIEWSRNTKLHEIAVSKGQLIPEKGVVPIQHRFGGEIEKLLTSQGNKVDEGDLLLRFKSTSIDSELKRARFKLKATQASKIYFDQEYFKRKELVNRGLESKIDFLALEAKKLEVEGEIQDLSEIVRNLKEQLTSLELKSPVSGYIHDLSIGATSIVKPGSTIMEIIPIDVPVVAEIDISPRDVGHVHSGQMVKLKIDSFDFNRYGAVEGVLKEVSPSTLLRPDGVPYYRGLVTIKDIDKVSFGPLIPGMTILADIHTDNKSVLEYLLKPIFASAQDAFRER